MALALAPALAPWLGLVALVLARPSTISARSTALPPSCSLSARGPAPVAALLVLGTGEGRRLGAGVAVEIAQGVVEGVDRLGTQRLRGLRLARRLEKVGAARVDVLRACAAA